MDVQIKNRKNKSKLYWDPDLQLGVVKTMKGKLIQQFGIHSKQIHYLYPEEVCFLLEKNAAELEIDGEIIDISTFYTTICSKLVGSNAYAVYKELRSNSFKVYRDDHFLEFPAFLSKELHTVSWIVYRPWRMVSKSDYQDPDYNVYVYSYDDPLPSDKELVSMRTYSSRIEILMAVVDENNEVSFYNTKSIVSEMWIPPADFVK